MVFEIFSSFKFLTYRLDNNLEEFRSRVKKCVRDSIDHIYDPPDTEDTHYIKFSQWDPEIHEPIRQRIYEPKVTVFFEN